MFILSILLLINLYVLFIRYNLANPLFIARCLLISAGITSLYLSLFLSSWFFYFIILVFLGGVMVVVLFICSICVNKKIVFYGIPYKLRDLFSLVVFRIFSYLFLNPYINSNNIISKTIIISLYQSYSGLIIAFLATFLLIAIVAVVSLRNVCEGPLR